MNLNKVGLTFNLIGSILLGFHIVGVKRLKTWEQDVKNLPVKVAYSIIGFTTMAIAKPSIKHQIYNWPGGLKEWASELQKRLKTGVSLPADWQKVRKDIFLRGFMTPLLIGLVAGFLMLIALSPIILILSISARPVAFIQNKLHLESFFGILGIILLVIGFILQMII